MQEVQSLDDDLNLFGEDDWDFIGQVVDSQAENYEYFCDMDVEFRKTSVGEKLKPLFGVACILFVMVLGVTVLIKVSGAFDNRDYENVLNMQSTMDGSPQIVYAKGDEGSSEDIIGVSQVLQGYFNILKAEDSYTGLYDYCYSTSTFADSYKSFTGRIEWAYDTSDCYARALREFGGFCSVGRITRLVVQEDIYYCYVMLGMPSTVGVQEYVYLYSYNLTKFFGSHDLNEANMIRALLEITEANPIPADVNEQCIRLKKDSSGNFRVVDDSLITSTCIEAYTHAVSQITKILSGSLASK